MVSVSRLEVVFSKSNVCFGFEARLWYGKCTYSERNDTNTKQLFIVLLRVRNLFLAKIMLLNEMLNFQNGTEKRNGRCQIVRKSVKNSFRYVYLFWYYR